MKTKLLILAMLIINSWVFSQEWVNISPTSGCDYSAIYPLNKDTTFVISRHGLIFRTFDGGDNWDEFNTNIDTFYFDMAFYDVDTGYATGSNGTIIKTTDKGENWTLLNTGTNNKINSIFINSSDSIWAVADSGLILNSFDYGNTWNINDTRTLKNLNSIKFRNHDTAYIAGDNGILLYTQNAGNSWDTLNTGSNNILFSISLTQNYIYLLETEYGNYNNSIFSSNDNINWTKNIVNRVENISFPSDSIGFGISSDIFTKSNPGSIFIYKTNNYGQSFDFNNFDVSNGGFFTNDIICMINDSTGYALNGCNILRTLNGDTITITQIKNITNNSFINIYPNPASSSINIELIIPKNKLLLNIIDLTGRIVLQKKITNNETINVSKLKKGIYFLNIKNENKIIENKKLIIK